MWSLISKELRFAVLDKTCAKQRAQLWCYLKLAPNHIVQLSFCLKWATIVKKQEIDQNRARNCKFTQIFLLG